MSRLAPSEVAEVVEQFLTLRPWVRPIAGIAAPHAIVGFVRHQLGDVRLHEHGWIAAAQWEGIAVTGTPRLGVLAQPAVIPWGEHRLLAATGPHALAARAHLASGRGPARPLLTECRTGARVHLVWSHRRGETGRCVHPPG